MAEKEKPDITSKKIKPSSNKTESYYRSIFEQSPDGMLIIDTKGKIIEFNEAACRHLGYSREEFSKLSISDIDSDQTPEDIEETIKRVLRDGNAEFEVRQRTKTGEIRNVRVITRVINLSGCTVFNSIWKDITDQRRAEEELRQLNRTLGALNNSSQALMRAKDETSYLNEVCRIIVKDCGHALVWIGFAEENEGKTVRPAACCGFDEGYIKSLNVTWADTERGRGPVGTAIRTGQPSVFQNMLTDPRFAPWRADALKRGYAAAVALPLLADGKAFGSITIYSREPDTFSDEEVKLLANLADDLAYGINSIRLRTAHVKAEEALRQSEEHYRTLFENMLNGYAYCRMLYENGVPRDFIYLDVNPAFEKLTGLKDVVGRKVSEVIPGIQESDPNLIEIYSRVALTGIPERFENYVGALDMWFWISVHSYQKEHFVAIFDVITDRKKAEDALIYSHSLLTAALDSTADGILVVDRASKVTRFNQKFLELWRIPESLVEMRDDNLLLNFVCDQLEDPEAFLKKVRDLYQTPEESSFDEIKFKDGRIFERYSQPQRISDNIVGRVWSFRDITTRKRAEEDLRFSEERYRSVVENIGIGISLISPNMEILSLNKQMKTWFPHIDVSSHPICYRSFNEPPREEICSYCPTCKTFQDGQVHEAMTETPAKDKVIFFRVISSPVKDQDGKIIAAIEMVEDITERKQAEEQMRKLSHAVEQTPASIIITDIKGGIEYVNPKFTEITGYSLEEVRGKNPGILKSGEMPPEESRKLWETITSGGEWHGVFHNKRKDGTPFWERASISAVRDSSGTITHFIAVNEDITNQKSLEDQFRQSQKMEAVGQLAGGISHDFNNILTAMMGYGHMLQTKLKDNETLRTYADHILSLSDRAAILTQSLLAFSRKQIMNPRPVNLNEVIKIVEKLLSRIIGEDIELRTVLAEKDQIVMADHMQIEQVLMNLATNARDAMPKGGSLTIETETVDIDQRFIKEHGYGKEGTYAVISITDSGAGMDRKTRERIFEPFFTTKGVGKGTGLGLSMVYGIIKQHEGYINVYSEPGKGTTFKIYLPLIEAKVDEIKPEVMTPLEKGTETILLAEDEAPVREFTRKLLEEYGYKVIDAVDGDDAIGKFKLHKDKIQLLVLDVIMPNRNGREVYETIKKIAPAIKVLFTSGYPAEHIKGMIAKGSEFILKPVSPTRLLKKIREVLDA